MAQTVILGSRGSALALAQTQEVISRLQALYPERQFVVQKIRTQGDRQADLPLPQIGGKGVFVKEIQEALLAGEIHLAVHSFKDLPVISPPGLEIAAFCAREDPRDVLVSRDGLTLSALPAGTALGTSSPRRSAQIRAVRPDLNICDLRGNLDTRLRKVAQGIVATAVLAAAGLKRMGWANRITEYLSPELCIPAVGQGALAVEIRSDDEATRALVAPLDHLLTRQAIAAERALLRHLGGGCHSPIAALGEISDNRLHLRGMVASPEGSRLLRGEMWGSAAAPEEVGILLAEELLRQGAGDILAQD